MRGAPPPERLGRVLFLSAFLVATCGLVYELVAGALASYLMGDSVTWFSIVIGTYLSAMGVGSWLSRYVEGDLLDRFVKVEIAVALVGGFSAPLLYAGFAFTPSFRIVLLGVVFVVGTGVGLELPLLMRILERHTTLRELVARVLFLDYAGALAASVAFPLVLLPKLGLFRTSLLFGVINAGVALWTTFAFDAPGRTRLRVLAGGAMLTLAAALVGAGRLEGRVEDVLFADPVVFRAWSPYQRIVVTTRAGDTRLFLNGGLQFSSSDEYRYHEALVHPALAAVASPKDVLVLGGGDGMAVREALRHPVDRVVLVDLDPVMTGLFRDREDLARLNDGALADPRVEVINADAFRWLEEATDTFDAVIVDFPDPNNLALGKLYTTHFYRLLARRLAPGGTVAVQATSPFFSPRAFWCIARTLEHEGFTTAPYHAYVPSFGEWGFVLATRGERPAFRPLPEGLRFLDDAALPTMFVFPKDMRVEDVPVNRLDNQALVRLYHEDWKSLQ